MHVLFLYNDLMYNSDNTFDNTFAGISWFDGKATHIPGTVKHSPKNNVNSSTERMDYCINNILISTIVERME